MSVGFVVAEDSWSAAMDQRTIFRFSELRDCSIVTYPASPQTTVELGSKKKRPDELDPVSSVVADGTVSGIPNSGQDGTGYLSGSDKAAFDAIKKAGKKIRKPHSERSALALELELLGLRHPPRPKRPPYKTPDWMR